MKLRKLYSVVFLALVAVLACSLSGCENSSQTSNQYPLSSNITVYATFYPVYDFTKKIGGDRVTVKCMVPPGADPHSWEPSPRDLAELQKARALVYNGAGMEPWMDKVLGALDTKSMVVVEATHCLPLLPADPHDGDAHPHRKDSDPHVWLDPVLAQEMAKNIARGLAAADPQNREFYDRNCAILVEKLAKLDSDYRNALEKCERRDIVVTHQAFGYMASRYGLKQHAIMGVSEESEPTPATMAKIIELCHKNNVSYIFFEKTASTRLAQVIAAETGAKVLVLDPAGTLTDEQLKAGEDYFSLMYSNLENLKKALGYKP